MSKFKSMNYILVECEGCRAKTSVEPGTEFSKLNCNCKPEKPKLNDTEISKPVQQELDYGQLITVIGTFKNGDVEVCSNNDLSNTFRIPKETFECNFRELPRTTQGAELNKKVDTDETPINDADNKQENTLSLEDIKGKTAEEIAAAYSLEELRALGKAEGMRNVGQTGEAKLIGKLLKKAE